MAQAQSPHERDGVPLAQTMSTEDGRGTRREGRFRRAISRMVRAQEPPSPETEQGHPVHHPVHPHSHNSGHTPSEPESEPATGPFTGSTETGYRPAVPAKMPNPYTVRRQEVDDVDTGATPVGTWRGVGMNEPASHNQMPPATTDAMTDSPYTAEQAGRPETPPAPTAETAPPAAGTQPSGGETSSEKQAPPPQSEPEPATPPHTAQQWQGQPPSAPHEPRWDGPSYSHDNHAPPPGGYPQAGHHGLPHAGPYPQQPPPPGYQQHPPYPPAPQGYGGYPRPGEYAAPAPPPYPMPYPQAPPYAYPSPYPPPYQPPGYVLPGQPVVHPSHFGQPVQHIIVFTPGQQPQVITADAVASTLLPERTDTSSEQESSEGKALTRGESDAPAESEISSEQDGVAQEAPEQPEAPADPEAEGTAPVAAQEKSSAEGAMARTTKKGIGEGLLNEALAGLAMRDLSLVDALLEMVETLETDAQDPDLLDKLFQIDNFATRMRRNGENFLVLTGHDGGESDAHDEIVPLLDVARAATSEIKDYPRVSLGKLPQTSITGMAADDISHLLAELLDNATANSPEHSQVVISAQKMDDGRLMVVVEDEGVGIPEAQLVELNERLGGEPVLDDEIRRHMGLYVASRIAHKHGLEIRLEARSFRGISAYAIVPEELLRVATPRSLGSNRVSGASTTPSVPTAPAGGSNGSSRPPNGTNPKGPVPPGGTSTVTSAGLPRRSATPHGSPLRMMPRPENNPNKPPARTDTPPKLTGDARAEQIRDELGDFLDGERAALEGEELDGGDKE